ncbi:MAG: hypothetical protein NZ898_10585 [Myxococcota bacterium]|nr:hypothetical protein [Myxococcota bacterium]MDW8361356.1 hypothetical protein [Myxococcales bacterium]
MRADRSPRLDDTRRSRRKRVAARWPAWLFAAAILAACDAERGDNAEGEACTRDRQCAEPLRCIGGICQHPERDGAPSDAPGGETTTSG